MVGGPVVFTATWATLGRRRSGYSAVRDPISRLAAADAERRWQMTAGFIAYSAGVGAGMIAARSNRPESLPLARSAAGASALGMLGIAAFPLGAPVGDGPHLIAAASTYAALAATSWRAARDLDRSGRRAEARAARLTGAATGAAFVASRIFLTRQGLFQRIGLSLSSAWIVRAGLSGTGLMGPRRS